LLSNLAFAQDAPKQLYNKSIVLSWEQVEKVKEPDGRTVSPPFIWSGTSTSAALVDCSRKQP
jgi:hypothetical protein